MQALAPFAALRRAWSLFYARPATTLGLAAALLTSLLAVCCGLGAFAAPWFLCELGAVLISSGSGRPTQRTRAWVWAGFVQMLAVAVLSSLALLTLLALGPDVLAGAPQAVPSEAHLLQSLGLLFAAGALALVLLVHFEHAPAILLERGGDLSFALLESARLVAASGRLRTWITSVFAHGLQVVPAVVALVLAASRGTLASTICWGVFLLPWMALGIALGQGMVAASYLALRAEVGDSGTCPVPATGLWSCALLLALVMAGPAALSAALLRPAPVSEGTLPTAAPVVLMVSDLRAQAQELYLPGTALSVEISARSVRVLASDGGGAGALPLSHVPVTRVRVATLRLPARTGPAPSERGFAIEVQRADGRTFVTSIDEAGVRLDDSLSRRFAQLLPGGSSLWLLGCFVWTALWLARALPRQAELRHALVHAPSPFTARAFERHAWWASAWLLPAALVSAALGAYSALR